MSRLCLDTSAYSYFARGHVRAVAEVDRATEVVVPVITLGELRIGFRLGNRESENERHLRTFLKRSVVRVGDLDEEASHHYVALSVELRTAGRKMSANDLWIAAVALGENATLLTFDAGFRGIPRLGSIVLAP